MGKKERAQKIAEILDTLYPDPQIPLSHKDPFTLLVAVLLSAQCTDARVNQITPRLFEKADTPELMARLDPKEIEEIIRPCGLGATKARALSNLSKQIISKHAGKVPASFEELEELPGVGHKTASVVMSQAFHQPAFPVDTHIHRCAHRWKLSSGRNVEQTERDLKRLFPKEKWNKIHLQIIYYARQYCRAIGHKKENCVVCSL
jgi:endonuclease-3